MSVPDYDLIFCGNPGTGKSTLLSSLSGEQFKSGNSYGSGLTSMLEWKTSPKLPGVRFGDTPGLADVEMKEQAAKAITTALTDAASKNRPVRIVFIVTTEAGRVRPDDQLTIKMVMESIKMQGGQPAPHLNSYAVIINKCGFLKDQHFLSGGMERIQLSFAKPAMMGTPFITGFVKMLPVMDFLSDQYDQKGNFPGLLDWINACQPLEVKGAEEIDTSNREEALLNQQSTFEAEIKKLEQQSKEELNKYKEDLDVTRHAMDSMKKQNEVLQQEMKKQNDQHDDQMHALESKRLRDKEDHDRSIQAMNADCQAKIAQMESNAQNESQRQQMEMSQAMASMQSKLDAAKDEQERMERKRQYQEEENNFKKKLKKSQDAEEAKRKDLESQNKAEMDKMRREMEEREKTVSDKLKELAEKKENNNNDLGTGILNAVGTGIRCVGKFFGM